MFLWYLQILFHCVIDKIHTSLTVPFSPKIHIGDLRVVGISNVVGLVLGIGTHRNQEDSGFFKIIPNSIVVDTDNNNGGL